MTVAKYTISYPSSTIREDGVVVPNDDSTPAFQRYFAFLQAGGAPTQIADQEMPEVREHLTATPFKIRAALNQAGLRQQIEDYVASCNDQAVKDAWEYSTEWASDSPLILGAISALGMTEDQVRDLFVLAKSL